MAIKKCNHCNGTGHVDEAWFVELANIISTPRQRGKVECYQCNGTGYIEITEKKIEKDEIYVGKNTQSSGDCVAKNTQSSGDNTSSEIGGIFIYLFLIFILATFFGGIGQFYNGQIKKGIIFMFAIFLLPIGKIVVIMWSIYDTYSIRTKMNNGTIPSKYGTFRDYVLYICIWFCLWILLYIIKFVVITLYPSGFV